MAGLRQKQTRRRKEVKEGKQLKEKESKVKAEVFKEEINNLLC